MRVILVAALALAFAGGKSPRRVPNMPRGWAWPPSAEMKRAGAQCLDDLKRAGVAYKRAPPTRKVTTPVVVADMSFGGVELQSIFRKPPFVLDCHLARALATQAPQLRALGIKALRFTTIHRYRTIQRRGRPTRILSRHAIGLAMDVFAVVLDDGRILEIEHDYRKAAPTLIGLEGVINASPDFRTLLTPGNDPKGHNDHFHFEARMKLGA